jgi:phage-related protein
MGGTNRNISVRAVGDFSNLSQGLQSASRDITSFGDRVKAKFKEIGEVGRGIKDVFEVFKEVGESIGEVANRAAELDGGMSSLNRTLGQSAVGYMAWANSTAKSFGISKMSAVEYGKGIAMLLGDVYKDQARLAAETEKLMQGGAVVAAKTGKSQQDVYERINSALMGNSEAVKALDINLMESALTHSQAYRQISNGTPWSQLTVEQQQYIRVTELNRQIQEKFGDTVGNGMDARLMMFKGTIDNLKTSLAEAFMPILYKVLPILTTFMSWIGTAINYVAAFFQVLFGYSGIQAGMGAGLNKHAQSVNELGDAYAKAGNKAGAAHKAISGGGSKGKSSLNSNGVASFDQVHTLSKSSNGGDGAGGTGEDGPSIPDMSTPLTDLNSKANSIADNLEKFREKVAGFANGVKSFFQGIGKFITDHKAIIISVLAGLAAALLVVFGPALWGLLVESVVSLAGILVTGLGAALSFLLSPIGLIAIAIGLLVGVFVYLFQTNKKFHDDVMLLWNALKKFFVDLGQVFVDIFHGKWGKALDDLKKAWSNLSPVLQKIWNDFWKWLSGVWAEIGKWFYKNVGKPIEDTWNGLKKSASDAMNRAWDAFKAPFVKAADWIHDNVVKPISDKFNSIRDAFKNGITDGLKAIVNNVIIDGLNGYIKMINGIVHKVPGFGSLTIPDIPHLANGGITNGPTLALIGDNPGGQEVVSPLDKLSGIVTNAVLTAMSVNKPTNSNVSGDIILNLDGRTFARIIKPYADLENKRVGANVRLQSI